MLNKKKSLIIIVVIVFLFQTIKFYEYYSEYSAWQYADWTINYQGGLIRRGLIGEILFKIHKLFMIRLDLIILIFVTSLFFLLGYFLIRSLKYLDNSKLDILIFLSPGFFIYPMMNSGAVGRKDILITLAVAFFVFFEKKFKSKNLLLLLLTSMFFVSLSHSGLLFYTPYLVFIYFLAKVKRNEKIGAKELISVLLFSLMILSFIIFNQGTADQVFDICQSVKEFVIKNCENSGQFSWLSTTLNENINYKLNTNYKDYTIVYLLSLFLVYF